MIELRSKFNVNWVHKGVSVVHDVNSVVSFRWYSKIDLFVSSIRCRQLILNSNLHWFPLVYKCFEWLSIVQFLSIFLFRAQSSIVRMIAKLNNSLFESVYSEELVECIYRSGERSKLTPWEMPKLIHRDGLNLVSSIEIPTETICVRVNCIFSVHVALILLLAQIPNRSSANTYIRCLTRRRKQTWIFSISEHFFIQFILERTKIVLLFLLLAFHRWLQYTDWKEVASCQRGM